MENVYSVGELTELLRATLERRFPFVWVRGEITNFSVASSGHAYFSLKDGANQLQCVWFAGKYRKAPRDFDPLTGEVYETPRPAPIEILRDGLEALCAGSIGVYAARGQYQLIIDFARPAGAGALALEFERLKARLAERGYFAQERKRSAPLNPRRVALVASATGAAIRDFLKIADERGLGSRVRLFNAPAQGKEAAGKIAAAIKTASEQGWADVIVVIRGGGSQEDLWAFNEEAVAEAIFNSRAPVVAGIGHEVDFSIADLTADVRAATPSHAAQLLWTPRSDLWQKLDELTLDLERRARNRIAALERELARSERTLALVSPERGLDAREKRLTELTAAAKAGATRAIRAREEKLAWLASALSKSRSPRLKIAMDGDKLARLRAKLETLISDSARERASRLENLTRALESLNPAAPLDRGYALLFGAQGPIRSARACDPGEKIEARLADGSLDLTINGVKILEK